jgi:enoyl-CoA hydratase
MGLVDRVVAKGTALDAAVTLAEQIAAFPQACMRSDRRSAIASFDLPFDEAMQNELRQGLAALESEGIAGAGKFAGGQGRHGAT